MIELRFRMNNFRFKKVRVWFDAKQPCLMQSLAFYVEGPQTKMGRTSRGGSEVLPEGFFGPATLDTSAMNGGA